MHCKILLSHTKKYSKNKIFLTWYRSLVFIAFLSFSLIVQNSFAADFKHGISTFGKLKYSNNFTNFDYVNPQAPKSGHIKFGVEGSFNSLNDFILKGIAVAGISYIYDSLTIGSEDEISSRYGLIAEKIKLADDKKSIDFKLRKIAKFHDGKNISADDVIFSFEILTKKGHPSYKMAFRDVLEVIKINDYHVRFKFKHANNRDLPLLISSLTILPKHYYENIDFEQTTLQPPLGSGPYKILEVEPNRSITYQRVSDYWAKDLAVNKGRYNFDKITFDYYRDPAVLVEAFKAQKYDFRLENIARNWANSYDIEAIKNGQIIKKEISHSLPAPMQAFIINVRREKLQNKALRQALNLAFNFEWLKQHIFYNSYTRTNSFFANTDFSYISSLTNSEILTNDFLPKESIADVFSRENIISAQHILELAGYKIIDQKLIDPKTNQQVKIEFLSQSQSFTMVIAPYIKSLKKLGIDAKLRMVEENQYKTRINNFDYDIIVAVYGQALIPGNELYAYFHSSQKDVKGSRNLIGLADKKIDNLLEQIAKANNLVTLKELCRMLDKILLENYYVIPQWYSSKFRILYRDIFAFPKNMPKYGLAIDSWYLK